MKNSFFFQFFVLTSVLSFACSCSLTVDAERKQCSRDDDCAALDTTSVGLVCEESFCRPPPRWACLTEPASTTPPTKETFTLSFLVRDTISQMPQAGLDIRICKRLGVDCAEKESVAATTDSSGNVQLTVPASFNGYVRFSGANIATTLYFVDPPVMEDRASVTISASAPETIAGLAALTKATFDPNLGVALVTAFDCQEKPVEGAKISAPGLGAQARAFYVRDGLPSTDANDTDKTGYSGVVNAPIGTLTFSAEIDGLAIGDVTVLVQPGAQSLARIVAHGP